MIELLNTSKAGGGSIVLPTNLGPGPQTLIGSYETPGNSARHTGFFGETLTSELTTGDALASLIALTSGVSQNSTDPWLKFLIDGRILYVAKRSLRNSIGWHQISAVNAVDGTRIVSINANSFKISLMKAGIENPMAEDSINYDDPATHGSEWNRLMYNVCASFQSKASQEGEQWATYSEAELGIGNGLGARSWSQETNKIYVNNRATRGANAVSSLNFFTYTATASSYGWRPVLELVP